MSDVSPRQVLTQVARAVPAECRENIIIVGSLAAGFLLLTGEMGFQVRTKDIDCVLSPRIEAVSAGTAIADKLLASGWTARLTGKHARPGNAETPDDQLPVVRLYPPDSVDWFIELLTVPDPNQNEKRAWMRMELSSGHYGLPSFRFMALAAFQPKLTDLGIYCARPAMMVLANLLEHPRIGPELMEGPIEGRKIKRTNKDLGRVLAIARLSSEQDMALWPGAWQEALLACFPQDARSLAEGAGRGLRALLGGEPDLEEALWTCNNGLLAQLPLTLERLRLTGERLMLDAIEPIEGWGRS